VVILISENLSLGKLAVLPLYW